MSRSRWHRALTNRWLGLLVVVSLGLVFIAHASDEINTKPQLVVEKGQLKLSERPGTITLDLNGDAFSDQIQVFTVGSTDEVSIATAVASNGIAYFHNQTTNTDRYVLFGRKIGTAFHSFLQIDATEIWSFRLHPTNQIYGHAVGGNVNTRCLVLED